MPVEQPTLPPVREAPGEPGTWWLDKRKSPPTMRRVRVAGEVTTRGLDTPSSSTETRVGR